MKKIKKYFCMAALVLLLAVSLGLTADARSIEPKITDVLVTNDAENVLLYARLINGFRPDMEQAVLAGIPAVFTMEIEVYQERPLVWDRRIARREIKRTLKYDNLKKTFSVSANGKTDPVVFTDFESAQKAMTDFNGIVSVPLSMLARGNNYYALIKIKMDKVRLPLHMEYVFLFVSLWDFETSWYQQRFSY